MQKVFTYQCRPCNDDQNICQTVYVLTSNWLSNYSFFVTNQNLVKEVILGKYTPKV